MPPKKEGRGPSKGRVYKEVRSWRDRATGEMRHYDAWSAWIRVDGRPRHTSYSVAKHGSDGAADLAWRWLKARRSDQKARR
jgi:hypothetical protein